MALLSSPGDWVIILVVALIIFGPHKVPELGRQAGRALRDFRKIADEFTGATAAIRSEVTSATESIRSEIAGIAPAFTVTPGTAYQPGYKGPSTYDQPVAPGPMLANTMPPIGDSQAAPLRFGTLTGATPEPAVGMPVVGGESEGRTEAPAEPVHVAPLILSSLPSKPENNGHVG